MSAALQQSMVRVECTSCGIAYRVQQDVTDDEINVICPGCGSEIAAQAEPKPANTATLRLVTPPDLESVIADSVAQAEQEPARVVTASTLHVVDVQGESVAAPVAEPSPRKSKRRLALVIGLVALIGGGASAFALMWSPAEEAAPEVRPAPVEQKVVAAEPSKPEPVELMPREVQPRKVVAAVAPKPSPAVPSAVDPKLLATAKLDTLKETMKPEVEPTPEPKPARVAPKVVEEAPKAAEAAALPVVQRTPKKRRQLARKAPQPADRIFDNKPVAAAASDSVFRRVDRHAALAQRLFRRHYRTLLACDKMADRRGEWARSRGAVFRVQVQPSGTVEVDVEGDDLSEGVTQCYERFLKRWPYPTKQESYRLAFRKMR